MPFVLPLQNLHALEATHRGYRRGSEPARAPRLRLAVAMENLRFVVEEKVIVSFRDFFIQSIEKISQSGGTACQNKCVVHILSHIGRYSVTCGFGHVMDATEVVAPEKHFWNVFGLLSHDNIGSVWQLVDCVVHDAVEFSY